MLGSIKDRLPLIGGLSGIVLIGVVIGTILGVWHDSKRDAVVQKWNYGKYAIGKCVLGSRRLTIKNCVASAPETPCKKDPSWDNEIKKAVTLWKGKLGDQSDFLRTEEEKDDPLGSTTVPIFGVGDNYRTSTLQRICEPLLWGADQLIQSRKFAYTLYPHNPGYRGTSLTVCREKIKEVLTRKKSSTAQWLRSMGRAGIVAHEIGHLLVGPYHPDPYAALMGSEAINLEITQTTLRIVRSGILSCWEL